MPSAQMNDNAACSIDRCSRCPLCRCAGAKNRAAVIICASREAAGLVADGVADELRLPTVGVGQHRGIAGCRLHHRVVGRLSGTRTGLAPAGQTGIDEIGPDRTQVVIAESQSLRHCRVAGCARTHRHSRPACSPGARTGRLLEINADALLAAVQEAKQADTPCDTVPMPRMKSPPSGRSTLMTSAPCAASIAVAYGPGRGNAEVDHPYAAQWSLTHLHLSDCFGTRPRRAGHLGSHPGP
jgi:hypothetical protein